MPCALHPFLNLRLIFTLWAVLGLSLSTGCAVSKPDPLTLHIYAAASLKETFETLKTEFETKHPQAQIALSFAGSQTLSLQIQQGAPAHLFASANAAHVQTLIDLGHASASQIFAHNEMALITPKNQTSTISSFQKLPQTKRLVIGTQQVPVGIYARAVLDKADGVLGNDFKTNVLKKVVSEESNTRLVRTKVALGEADAAFVYLTDARHFKEVSLIPIPKEFNVQTNYYLAPISGHEHHPLTQKWMSFVLSPKGQALLARHGFQVTR